MEGYTKYKEKGAWQFALETHLSNDMDMYKLSKLASICLDVIEI